MNSSTGSTMTARSRHETTTNLAGTRTRRQGLAFFLSTAESFVMSGFGK
jgi:hypothetical protein